MFRNKWVPLAAVALLSGSVLVYAEDAATTPPAAAEHHHTHKLVKPWSEVTGLSDEQKTKIMDAHAKALEEMKVIRDKEKEEIMAVLTDDQKKQAEELESKGGHKAAEAPETQPAAK